MIEDIYYILLDCKLKFDIILDVIGNLFRRGV